MNDALIERLLSSGEHLDSEGMPLTIVDALFSIAGAIDRTAEAIDRLTAAVELEKDR